MKVITHPEKLNKLLKRLSCSGKRIGLVPTMGALHLGHLSLIKQAANDNQIVVVSIFVNPTQFGPKEDLLKYPRPLKRDLALCRAAGANLVFCPQPKSMYASGFSTYVEVLGLSSLLCGATRPGHFRGVTTVVAKLLNLVRPDLLYLGQKDAQQTIIIKRMINDLNFPVKVRVIPTVRQADGLALSSRNVYLTSAEKIKALVISKSLLLAKTLIDHGQSDTDRIIRRMKELISKKKQVKIDYVAIVDLVELKPLKRINQDCLIALAVLVGKTRLIDNQIINYA